MEVDRNIERYVEAYSGEEPSILYELRRETYLTVLHPRMIAGHIQGKLLKMLCQIHKPKRVLEIGTYTAYSTITIAMGTADGCTIDTIESNDELRNIIDKYVRLSGYADRINVHFGEAMDVITDLRSKFDFVFIDADKRQYVEYFDAILPLMNKGAVIIADDVLWNGKVVSANTENIDKQTQGIARFNKHVNDCPNVENIILPIRHGLMLMIVQ